MLLDKDTAGQLARQLLQINAIKLSPQTPFVWASGMHSPVYCDNRLTLSYPGIRDLIKEGFRRASLEHFPDAEGVAGVATAGIPHAALLADALALPFVYVRSKAKGHGLGNQIEGKVEPGMKLIVVEDLISTGGSSLAACDALLEAKAEVMGMLAVFTYGFESSYQRFEEAKCPLITLSDYPNLIEAALKEGLVEEQYIESLKSWYLDPKAWDASFSAAAGQ